MEQDPPINYVLREFRIWLISKIIEDRKEKLYPKRPQWPNNGFSTHNHTNNSILWIEKLLQTPITDNRKYVIWRILVPYLLNIKKISEEEAVEIIRAWLNKCHMLRLLDFNAKYLIRQNIKRRSSYPPISFTKLRSENHALYGVISEGGN